MTDLIKEQELGGDKEQVREMRECFGLRSAGLQRFDEFQRALRFDVLCRPIQDGFVEPVDALLAGQLLRRPAVERTGLLQKEVVVEQVERLGGDRGGGPAAADKIRVRRVEQIQLTWLKKCAEARTEAAKERERSRIGRIARRKATVEVIL